MEHKRTIKFMIHQIWGGIEEDRKLYFIPSALLAVVVFVVVIVDGYDVVVCFHFSVILTIIASTSFILSFNSFLLFSINFLASISC